MKLRPWSLAYMGILTRVGFVGAYRDTSKAGKGFYTYTGVS